MKADDMLAIEPKRVYPPDASVRTLSAAQQPNQGIPNQQGVSRGTGMTRVATCIAHDLDVPADFAGAMRATRTFIPPEQVKLSPSQAMTG